MPTNVNYANKRKFCGNRGKCITFAEIRGEIFIIFGNMKEFSICIISLGWMDAPV